ncbi:MAG: hypothetical protein LBE51_21180 [Acidovorax sp.]|nr:hypothetical protein [Acidovorax sp.]
MKSENTNPDADIDLLDVLVIISSQFKLILLCAILGAFIAWILAYAQATIYSSISSLNVEALKQDEKSPKFKSEVIASLVNVNQDFRDLLQEEWGEHASITASVSPRDRLLIITTTSSSPSRSQKLNELVLEKIYAYTMSQSQKHEYVRTLIDNEKNRIVQIEAAARNLKAKENSNKDIEEEIIGNLLRYKTDREINIIRLQESIEGITRNNVIQAPNLPTQPAGTKTSIKIILGAIGGMVLALPWILILHFIRMQSLDKKTQEKWKLVAKNIGYK